LRDAIDVIKSIQNATDGHTHARARARTTRARSGDGEGRVGERGGGGGGGSRVARLARARVYFDRKL
jgi:hypothetical protein